MIINEKKIYLKNNNICYLRSPQKSDALDLISHLKQMANDTNYLSRYPEEVDITVTNEEKFLEYLTQSKTDFFINAYIDDYLVGNLFLNAVDRRLKFQHRATIGISIKKEYWNLGIGSVLINEAISNAIKLGYEQLELEVASKNTVAIRLYEKYGFVKYGELPNGFKFKDGTYCNQLLMYKNLI